MNRNLPPAQRAQLLVNAMRLDEKLQQIYNLPIYNAALDASAGSVDGDGRGCDFQRVGRHIEGIPALDIPNFRFANGGTGVRGGDCLPEPTATGLPSQVASAAMFNPQVAFQWGEVLDNEIFGWSHQVLWGPGLNMIRTPFGGRNHEYMSEDPYLTGRTASEIVKGVQAKGRTQATIKHFAGNETEYPTSERWTGASRIPSRAYHEMYLLPFEMAVRDAKPASVMCAYPHVNFEWNCDSHALLTQTLRQRWGFDGYVVSDRRAQHSTAKAIKAGDDWELDFEPEFYTPELVKAAIASGEISVADIDRMLLPRYTKMFQFGDFDTNYDVFHFDQVTPQVNNAVARRAADESITLLKNENNTLPLNTQDVGDIALIGASWFAGQATMPPRSGDPQELSNVVTNPALTVSPRDGLVNTLRNLGVSSPGSRVTYNDGDVIADAVDLAEDSDTVILMVGDNPRETIDVQSVTELPSITGTNQQLLVPRILEANPNTIVVLKTQGMIVQPWFDDVDALVEAWYPGQQDGNAVADMLFGVTNPSGKLPVTFGNTDHEAAYSSTAQFPGLRENNGLGGGPGGFEPLGLPQIVTHYTEGLELGYRWYEANNVPSVFPFGHGLSYTRFDYSDLSVTTAPGTAGNTVVTVAYTIRNSGLRAGKETSQVYLTLPRAANEPPKRLVGFQKVDLARNGTARVTVTIDSAASNHPLSYFVPDDPQDLTKWADGNWATPSGTFTVQVGGSSTETPLRGTFALAPAAAQLASPGAGNVTAASQANVKAAFASQRARSNLKRVVKVRVRCPLAIGARGCRGTLIATRDGERIARKRIALPAGRTSTVRLRISREAYRTLVRRGSLSVRLALRVRGKGKVQRTSRSFRLLASTGSR